ncbi:MAG: beta-ketoacyl-[acyl-carrier-protein] synthase family protein, partial [Candidatus Binatia bacterium]
GRCVIRRNERLHALGFPHCCGGEISQPALDELAAVIPQRQKKLMNRATILAVMASFLAAREASLETAEIDPARLGVFLATWFTFYDLSTFMRCLVGTELEVGGCAMNSARANVQCMENMNPVDSLKLLPNLTAGHLAIFHKAQGCSRVIADGWRGGLLAIAQAAEAVRCGELDAALAGGSDMPLEEGVFCDLSILDVMAKNGTDANRLCRPFDRDRHGTVFGEGAGLVVLEEREHALRRGAQIVGEIIGASSCGPARCGRPEGSVGLSMRQALERSGLDPFEVDVIHANGDGIREHDRAEWRAVRQLFGAGAASIPVTATKSIHGHLLSASGAVELISSLTMLDLGLIPPIANCESPDADCDLDLVTGSPRTKPGMKSALLNAVGLFGEAATLVVRR